MPDLRKTCHLFQGFSKEEFEKIDTQLVKRKFNQEEVILHPKRPNKNIFIISNGIVKLESSHEHKKFTLNYLHEGEFFGHIGIFSNGISKVQATCITDAEVYQLKQSSIEELLLTSPLFVHNLLSVFAKKTEKNYDTIHALAFRTVRERTANKLLELAKIFTSKTKTINIPLTQQELANCVGTARENISKVLAELKELGAIELQNKNIVILDSKILKMFSNTSTEA